MEIDKTLALDAPPERVWALLLDPAAMATCVPGMESVEIVSDSEYAAVMKVKISFVSARFRLRTRIVERDAPRYLRAEGTGEDNSVSSSLKQVSEMWLEPGAGGATTMLRLKVQVDVLGRIGSFGLSAMKTKADRLWDEFGANLAVRLAPAEATTPAAPASTPGATDPAPLAAGVGSDMPAGQASPVSPVAAPPPGRAITLPASATHASPARPRLWQRLFGARPEPIRVELHRGDTHLVVSFPVEAAAACTAWLRTLSDPQR